MRVDSDTVRSVTLSVTSSEVKMSVVEEIREQRSSSAPPLSLSRDIRPRRGSSAVESEVKILRQSRD